MLLAQLKFADVSCEEATLRTSPSSGRASTSPKLRPPMLLAYLSRAALEGSRRESENLLLTSVSSTAWAETADLLRIRSSSDGCNSCCQGLI